MAQERLPFYRIGLACCLVLGVLFGYSGRGIGIGGTERISVGFDGQNAAGTSRSPAVSRDGRYIAFVSWAPNLVEGDTHRNGHVFLRDRLLGETAIISSNEFSGPTPVTISANGRYVAFSAWSTPLGGTHVFVYDRIEGRSQLVDTTPSGEPANNTGTNPSLSEDGRYIAFNSAASDLVPDDRNNTWDVFVKDLQSGTTRRVSVGVNGQEAEYGANDAYISSDGSHVAFSSVSNLMADTTYRYKEQHVYSVDLRTQSLQRVDVGANGTKANGYLGRPSGISGDGRFIVFTSDATNLAPISTQGKTNVYVWDRSTGKTVLVSSLPNSPASGHSEAGVISDDGRFVAFVTEATNLSSNDNNAFWDVYLRDMSTGGIERVSVSYNGAETNGDSRYVAISGDGSVVAYDSTASNLVPNDLNWHQDVFAVGSLSDTQAPTLRWSVTPGPNERGWNTGPVSVFVSASDGDNGTGVRAISVQIGQSEPQSFGGGSAEIPLGKDGVYRIAASARDMADNQSATVYLRLGIDSSPPAVTFEGLGEYGVDQRVKIACKASDPLSGLQADPCLLPLVDEEAATIGIGTHQVSVTAVDSAGNETTASGVFTVGLTYDSLCLLTTRYVSDTGVATSLCKHLESAKKSKGNSQQLVLSYVREVLALSGKKLNTQQALTLIQLAFRLLDTAK